MSIRQAFLNNLRARSQRGPKAQPSLLPRTGAEPLEARIAPAAVLTATMIDTWVDADGDGEAEPGEIVSYEIIITNTGDAVTTNGVRFEDLLEANLVLVGGSLNVSPLALDDAYTAVRNTQLQVGPVTGAPTGPQLSVSGSLFDNDREFLADGYTLSAIGATAFGGSPTMVTLGSGSTVTVDAEGNFTYLPAAGFAGSSETFTYTIRDDGTDGIAGNADDLSSVGTVTINLAAQEVWYVDNSYAGANGASNGTSTRPFTSLGSVTGATGPDGINDIIYVASGGGAYTGTMALLNGQKLLGAAVELTIPGVGLLQAAGTRPAINAAGDAVTVSATAGPMLGIEIRGLSLQGSANAIDVTASGANAVGVTIDNNVFAGAGQEAVDLNAGANAAFGVTFTNNTVNASTGNAFDARTTAGSAGMTLSVSNNTITSAATGVFIDSSAAGTTTITGFANNIITGNTGGGGVSINSAVFDASASAGFQVVNGGTLAIGAVGNGVGTTGLVLTSVSGDLSFTDLDIYADGGVALRATSSGVFNAGSSTGFRLQVASGVATIDANGGPALDMDTVLFNLPNATVESTNSPTRGINLVNVDGSTLTATNSSSISGLIGGLSVAFRVVDSTGTITFNGPISTSVGTGVELLNNTGATISLGGTLTISSGNSVAFRATGGGTVNVTGTGNTLTTTTGTALNVVNTTIGASHISFQSISSTGTSGNSGIVLNNTGTAVGNGGLIVTGTGSAGSGGTISNKTVDGISLNSTRGVFLARMVIDNNDGSGISGTNVTDFLLINSTVSNNADTATGAEAGLRFTNLWGTSSITNSTFAGQAEDHVRITNNSGTLTNLAISGSTFNANSAATGGHGISMINTGNAVATITVNTTNFTSIRSSAILVNGTDTTNNTLNVTGGTFTDIGSAVTVQSDQSADLNFNVSGITSVRAISNAIQLVAGSTSTPSSNIVGIISSNIIGNGAADSGSRDMYGIAIDLRGDQDSILSINNNNIRNTDISGIFVNSADFGTLVGPSARMDLHLRDNAVGTIDDNSAFPFFSVYGVLVDVRHTTTAYLDVAGNSSTGLGGFEHFRFRQRDTSQVFVERLTDGDGTPGELINNVATVESFFAGQNDAGSTVDATLVLGFTEAADGAARDPLLFLPTEEPVVVTPPPAEETPTEIVTVPEVTDEPEITPPPVAPEDPGIANDGILSQAELDTLVDAAIARWAATGLSAEQIALLQSVTFTVSDLSGWSLGAASGTTVTLDVDAAGNDWFVDATPLDDIEFVGSGSRMAATFNGGANGRVDALTTVMHELGHVLGLEDSYEKADRESLMYGWIGAGERRLAQAGEAESADPSEHVSEPVAFIGGPINIGDLPAGKGVTIRFQATVNPAILVNQVSNQGFVRDNGGALLATTDDPSVAGATNPNVTPVDLPDVTVGVSAPTIAEDGSGALTYTFTREGSTSHAITVNFGIGGTAASASDFTVSGTGVTFDGSTGTLVIPAGSSTATITVSPTDDSTVEADETVMVNVLAGPVGAPGYEAGTINSATATILNDDTDVSVAVSPASVTEDGAGNLVYTFTRVGVTSNALTVNFSVGGAAAFGTDYTQSGAASFDATTGTVTFAAGATTATVTIDSTVDSTVESDETAVLSVTSGTGYNVAGTAATGTIANDDTDVTLAITPASVNEDSAGNLVYTFTRNGVTSNALTVNFNVGGTATFNTDYTQTGAATFNATTGTVTFAAGATTATVTIDPTADSTVEGDETTLLTLAAGAGYNAVTATAVTGTITNDDTDVTLSVAPASVSEDGAGNLVYTFTRNGVTSNALTVNFSVGGTAAFNTDYSQSGAATFTSSVGTVTFAAGATTATVTIDPTADSTVESDETAILTITAGTGYNAATPSAATGTIANDDTDVSVAVAPASVTEDGAGNLVYTFTRNGVTSNALTVNFSVGGTAAFSTDYTQSGAATFTSSVGTVTFAAGATTATVTIDPSVDSTVESDETAVLTVTSGTGYNVAGTPATGTIANDDTDVTLAIAPASVTEDGAGNLVYTFTRTGVTSNALTVNFNVGGTATLNTDYTQSGAATFTSGVGTVTFAAGATTATVTIDPTADSAVEGDETTLLTLASGTGYNAVTATAVTGTITNDDTDVTLSVAPASVTEDGAGNLVYTFTRTGVTSNALTVNFSVGGTATFNTDYSQSGAATFTSSVGTVTFAAGATTATVTIDPTVDSMVESDETAILTITAGTGYSAATPGAATGMIANDDTDVSLAVSPASVLENGGGALTYTFTRVGVTTDVLTVNFGVSGNAEFNTDYAQSGATNFTSSVGSVTFDPGQATATVTLTPISDDSLEGDEMVALTLGAGSGYSAVTSGPVIGTILNDDAEVTVLVAPASVTEDGAGNLVYTFTRNGYVDSVLTVNFNVGGGAVFNSDYTQSGAEFFSESSGMVTFAPGSTTATITVDPTADSVGETDETVGLTLINGTGYTLGTSSAVTGTILNDDTFVSIALTPGNILEGSGAGLVYTITRTGDTSTALTVNFNVAGTAELTADYTQTGAATFGAGVGTIVIPAGSASATITLANVNDTLVEGSETALLTLTGGAGYSLGGTTAATGTIDDNDTAIVRLTSATNTTAEGAAAPNIGVELVITANGTVGTGTLARPVSVNLDALATGTAGLADFIFNDPATVTFAVGQSSTVTNVPVTIVNDAAVEGTETLDFALNGLNDGTGGSVTLSGTTAHTLTINDNDTATIGFAAPNSSINEGVGETSLGFILTIIADGVGTPTLARDVTFQVNQTSGTAVGGTDYTITTPVTFAAGAVHNAVQTTSLTLTNDTFVEGSETANFGLAIGTDGTGGRVTIATGAGAHAATIVDNDTATIGLAQGASTVSENGVPQIGVVLTITANGQVGVGTLERPISLVVGTTGGTATSGTDYTFASPQTITFGVGATSATQTLALTLSNDTIVEGDETILFATGALTDGSGGQVTQTGPTQHTLTIDDNDTARIDFVLDTSSTAFESESTHAVVMILRITGNGALGVGTLGRDITVTLNDVAGDTATLNADYTEASNTVTFQTGMTTGFRHLDIGIINDARVEGSETISYGLALTGDGTNGQASLGSLTTHTVNITDNDTATVSLVNGDSSVGEAGGTHNIGVSLVINANGTGTPTLERNVSVNLRDLGLGSAIAGGSDYNFNSPQTITFASGETNSTKNFTVGIVDDTRLEGNETIAFETANFVDGTLGQVTFTAGTTHNVTILDNETATIALVQAASAIGEDAGSHQVGVVLTITANGVVGTGTLERAVGLTLVNAGGTAVSGADYILATPQTVTFAAGATSSTQSIGFELNNDTIVEGSETLIVEGTTLNDGSNGQVTRTGPAQHTVTITDNDTARIELVGASSVTNENAGTHRVDVRLIITANGEANSGTLGQAITVTLPELGGDTAVLNQDYTLPSNTLVFAAGATSSVQGMDVGIINDARVEGSETVAFGLQIMADGTNGQASLGTETTHTVTVGDNDIATLSLVSGSSTVGEAGGTHNIGVALIITANGEGTPMLERNVSVSLRDLGLGTATAGGSDYNFAAQTVTFVGGDTDSTKSFSVGIVDDTRWEEHETIAFEAHALNDGTGGQVTFAGDATHDVMITDNEHARIEFTEVFPEIFVSESVGSTSVGIRLVISANGQEGAGTLERDLVVTLSDYQNGTASSGGIDYSFATPQTITFEAGQGSGTKTVPFNVSDDLLLEGDEYFQIHITDVSSQRVPIDGGSSRRITILNNDIDLEVTKTAWDPVVVAGSGVGNLIYEVTVYNRSSTTATGVVMAEDLNLPSGVTIASVVVGRGVYEVGTGDDGVWTIGTIPANGWAVMMITLTVDASAAEGVDVISNTATITASNETRLNAGNDSATAAASVDRQVDLVVSKTDEVLSTIPGATLTYVISYRNDGVSNATGVALTEYLPTGTVFNAAASSAWVEVEPGVYRLDVGGLAASGAGSATFAVTVSNPVQAGLDTIVNGAGIADDGTAGADLSPANNVAQDIDTLETAPDLRISIEDAPSTAIRGGTTAYTVTYANVGSQNATGVMITMTLPDNTFFDPFTSTGFWQSVGGNVYTTMVGDVVAGATAGSVIFAVRLDPNTGSDFIALTTTGTIADDGANGVEPTPADNTDTEVTPLYQGIYAVSPGVALPRRGGPPVVRVFDVATNTQIFAINAYDASYRDSIRIAMGDINGDGYDDIITSTRKTTGSVRVFDGRTGERFEGAFAEIAAFTEKGARGAFVASGDVTGDGRDDIIVGSGQGARGSAKVKVFDGRTGDLVSTSEPFGTKFRGGVRVAAGDVNGDGLADIIAAQGYGGNDVKVTSGTSTTVLHNLEIGGSRYRGGVFVAVANLDGDDSADLIVGRDRGPTVIETFSGATGTLANTIVPFGPKYRLGVRVAAADINFDGIADIVAGAGGRGRSEVKIFDGTTGSVLHTFTAFPTHLTGSLFVAGTSPVPAVAQFNEQPA